MDYLKEIGIERWRLRQAVDDNQQATAPAITEQTVETLKSESISSGPTAKAEPIETPSQQIEQQPEELAQDSWTKLLADFESQTACECCQNSGSILGEGQIDASLMVIVDGPSKEDIQAQQLVSGRAGKLLDAILFSIGFDREKVYLSSVFKCPAGGPEAADSTCNNWLRRQLDLIQPKAVLLMGDFTAQAVLQTNDELPVLRNSIHQKSKLNSAFVASYDVLTILQNPQLKSEVWTDLQVLSASLNE